MRIVIYTRSSALTGGNIRVLNVLKYFPNDKYMLVIPRNYKKILLENIKRHLNDDKLYRLVESAHVVSDFNCNKPSCFIEYGRYIGREAARLGADLLYYPHEEIYSPFGFSLSKIKWTQLLQTTPLVGALSIEKGKGFELLIKNLKLNFNYNIHRLIYIPIYKYIILKSFALIIRNAPLLTVSRSIPYELERLGVKANIKVVEPGVGVDPCPYANSEKLYDLVFFARVVPEKGIFDYLKVVASLVKRGEKIKALVVGFADDKMSAEVRRRAADLGISRHVEFRFNAPRQEALRLVASSKVMVYPTRLDAFPLAVLEALSCGTPVVAYGIPAIRFNYETDVVVKTKPLDVGELIYKTARILKEELWRDLGIEGIKFSEKYTWENVAKTEWQLLKEIAENNREYSRDSLARAIDMHWDTAFRTRT